MKEKFKEDVAIFRAVQRADPIFQVKSRMLEKGLKVRDVSERTGISKKKIKKWLRGESNIRLDNLYALAYALDVSLRISFGEVK